jgi:EAL domain-containing protein (putative c-di-GMP-specific phosphodiesterase class I)
MNAADATALAKKVGAAVAAPVITDNDEIAVTASIGIAQPTEAVTSPADLMVQADLALYRAKAEGRNRHCFHDQALDRRGSARTLLAKELRSAFARGELEVLYKPQVHIGTGRICGLEARLQWNHPSRGIITPRLLVPLAERAGIIRAVANWSIDEACGQLRKWQDNGLAPPPLAVDLFASQFRVAIDIGSDLGCCLAKHRVDARQIELECDEQVFMHVIKSHPGTLEALHEQRFRLAVVDFGAGSSSIACLARAPVNRLKIAPSLVRGVPDDAASASAIRAVLRIAEAIGAEAIADGVETHTQAAFLLSVGCDQAQGPFFSPPLSAVEVTLLLRDARPESQEAQKSSAA